jgi:hypothetical protein
VQATRIEDGLIVGAGLTGTSAVGSGGHQRGKKDVAGFTSETLVPIFDKQIFDKWSGVAGL